MKTMLKKIIPNPVMNKARGVRDAMSLSKATICSFNTKNLAQASVIDIKAIFADPQIKSQWDEDSAVIANILYNEEKYGGVNPGDRRAIYALVSGLTPQNVLEVGTHIGASTLYIARALKSAGVDGHVDSVDIYDVNEADSAWKKVGLKASPSDNMSAVECETHVTFSIDGAQDFMKNTQKRFDFIFLDGDHGAAAVYNEISYALDILNPGGVILLHDYYPDSKPLFPDGNVISGPFMALERIKNEGGQLQVLPLDDLPWITKQGVNKTSLALVLAQQ